jgi:hypothetical protein
MSNQSHIKNVFKAKSADEIEVEELLLTQFSRASRAKTLETATTISTISTNIISIMDLSNDINNIESLVNYDSDDSVADVDINGANQPSFHDLDSSGCVVSLRKSLRYNYKIEFITLWLAVCQKHVCGKYSLIKV